MRLEDHIKMAIHKYPILYKDRDYQTSRMKVLGHIFLVLGNGVEFSDPCREYLVHPQYHEVDEDWVRIPDAPYGQEVYEGPELDQAYFDTPIYRDYSNNDDILELIEKGILDKGFKSEEKSYHDFRPYPLSDNANLTRIMKEEHNLQQDWIDGCSDVAIEALRYYDTPKRFHRDSYFPSPMNLHETLKHVEEHYNTPEKRKEWSYDEGESILAHSVKMWIRFHAKTIKELDSYLSRYSSPVDLPRTPSYQELYDEIYGYLFSPNCIELFEMIGRSEDPRIQKLRGNYRMPQEQFEQFRDNVTKAAP